MSSPYDPLAGLDVDEQIRRRQLLQNMFGAPQNQTDTTVSFGQQPTTQPAAQITPWQQPPVQPPTQQPQFDPQTLANIQKNLPFGQPQIPPAEAVTQAGTRYSDIAGQQVDPKEFKRNKLAAVMLAPFMLKPMLRDPRAGREIFDELTRKGYLTAEEEHARNLEQAKTDYTVKQQVFRDQLASATEGIKGNNEFIQQQIHLMDLGIKTPLEIQKSAAELQRINLEIAKLKAGDVMTGEPWHLTVDGKSVVGFPTKGPDGLGWVDASNEKLKGNIAPISKVTSGTGSEFTQRKETKLAALGHPASPKEEADIENQVRLDMEKPAEDRRAAAEKAKEEAASKIAAQKGFEDTAKPFRTRLATLQKPLDLELQSLRSLQSTASLGGANGVAAQMAIVETATSMAGGARPVSRYNANEINKIMYASGGVNEIRAKLDKWVSGESGVPTETLKQIGQLQDIVQKELRQQQRVIAQYQTEVARASANPDKTKAAEQIADINERFDDAIASAGQPKPLPADDPLVRAGKAAGIKIQ